MGLAAGVGPGTLPTVSARAGRREGAPVHLPLTFLDHQLLRRCGRPAHHPKAPRVMDADRYPLPTRGMRGESMAPGPSSLSRPVGSRCDPLDGLWTSERAPLRSGVSPRDEAPGCCRERGRWSGAPGVPWTRRCDSEGSIAGGATLLGWGLTGSRGRLCGFPRSREPCAPGRTRRQLRERETARARWSRHRAGSGSRVER